MYWSLHFFEWAFFLNVWFPKLIYGLLLTLMSNYSVLPVVNYENFWCNKRHMNLYLYFFKNPEVVTLSFTGWKARSSDDRMFVTCSAVRHWAPQDETWTDFDGPSWIQYGLFRKNKLPGSKNVNLAKFMLRAHWALYSQR